MKLYIFLTNTLSGVGGGQLYLADKATRLEEDGWKVRIIYYRKGEIVIPALKKFKDGLLPELSYSFPATPLRLRRRTASFILGYDTDSVGELETYESIVIESFNYQTALWGEYVARVCRGVHLFYLLTELWKESTPQQRDFLRFKMHDRLLYAITVESIPPLLPETDGSDTQLTALGCGVNPPDASIPGEWLDGFDRDRFTILVVSRLEKQYIPAVLKSITEFCQAHSDKKFNMILIGDGAAPDSIHRIRKHIVSKVSNLSLYTSGFLYPIPAVVFEYSDVALESAGSARVTADNGVTTISIDANDCKGIGIFRETTQNRIFRDPAEPPVELTELLETIYRRPRKTFEEKRKSIAAPSKNDNELYQHHLSIISSAIHRHDKSQKYYELDCLKLQGWKDRVTYLVLRLGGKRILDFLKSVKRDK